MRGISTTNAMDDTERMAHRVNVEGFSPPPPPPSSAFVEEEEFVFIKDLSIVARVVVVIGRRGMFVCDAFFIYSCEHIFYLFRQLYRYTKKYYVRIMIKCNHSCKSWIQRSIQIYPIKRMMQFCISLYSIRQHFFGYILTPHLNYKI